MEQRNYTRIVMRGKITLTTGGEKPTVLEGELFDVCFGGFGGAFKQELPIGMIVSFKVTPEIIRLTLEGKAEVRNLRNMNLYGEVYHHIGFQFTEVDKYMIVGVINAQQTQAQKKNTSNPMDPNWGPI